MKLKKLNLIAVIFLITTAIFGIIYATTQQALRHSANDPQIQMAEDAATALNMDANPQTLPAGHVILQESLAPFLIIYDDSGKPIASSGYLAGKIPVPPNGVFDYTRNAIEDRVTWQPAPGVRIAAVITRYNSGFVLAGRSLREVERREDQTFLFAAAGWLFSVALLLLSFYFLGGK